MRCEDHLLVRGRILALRLPAYELPPPQLPVLTSDPTRVYPVTPAAPSGGRCSIRVADFQLISGRWWQVVSFQ